MKCSKCNQDSPITFYSDGIPTCIECIQKTEKQGKNPKASKEESLVTTMFSFLKKGK